VVAKLLRPDQTSDAAARRVLAAEADMLGRLAHRMLVRAFDAALDGERPHLVLELVEGPRLSTLIRRGNDATAGGDNSYVAPAPAPNYGGGGGWSDDGGGYGGDGGYDGGGGGGWSDDGGGSDG
jgi:hypothetical protein